MELVGNWRVLLGALWAGNGSYCSGAIYEVYVPCSGCNGLWEQAEASLTWKFHVKDIAYYIQITCMLAYRKGSERIGI